MRLNSVLISRPRRGFTLIELLFVLLAIGILLGLLLPAVSRTSHGAARRTDCANRMRQIVLACHNYHDAHKRLPPAMGRLDIGGQLVEGKFGRTSGLIAILPFMEQSALWDEITSASEFNGTQYPPMGPNVNDENYRPWTTQVPGFLCPSAPRAETPFGQVSYAFSIGDTAREIHRPQVMRGAFACQRSCTLEQIHDGTSNTLAMAEMRVGGGESTTSYVALRQTKALLEDPSLCHDLTQVDSKRRFLESVKVATIPRGGCWADGSGGSGLVNTILPPGSPSAVVGSSLPSDGIFSADSWHNGGINAVFADGSVHFLSFDINAGDPTLPTLTLEQLNKSKGIASPYGVWGAIGSADGEDSIDEMDY